MIDDLDIWLAALASDEQPSAAELDAAPLIEGWWWAQTDTAGLYVCGFIDGRVVVAGEVITVDAGRRWVRDRTGVLWRLLQN